MAGVCATAVLYGKTAETLLLAPECNNRLY